MADEIKQADGKEVSPTVALFQKAHASLVTLQRIDEQLISLADRRRKVQAELRDAQTQLNEEMDRAAAMPQEMTSQQAAGMAVPRRRRDDIAPAIAEAA
jgi:DNA repair ATPase RecN